MSEVSTVAFDKEIVKDAKVTKGQEMGMFFYGGSSFAIIYEKLPNKALFFVDANGTQYDQDPPPPGSSSGTGGEPTNIGAQIGLWVDL
jgi:phosphatidylserine decarboxylase